MELAANVPSEHLRRIKIGQPATVGTDASGGQSVTGNVLAIAPAVDTTTNAGLVRIRVANPDHTRQLRSRATMERVLTAVEELLVDKPFDQITIAEIAARASSSPTSIYARFTDKSGLLLAAHERFKHQAEKRLRAQIDSGELADLAPRQIFDAFVLLAYKAE